MLSFVIFHMSKFKKREGTRKRIINQNKEAKESGFSKQIEDRNKEPPINKEGKALLRGKFTKGLM